MKRFLILPLVAVVFAVACTDATAPANSHALLIPKDPSLFVGNPPPPPMDAAINVCVRGRCHAFNGVYFSNGSRVRSDAAGGTAWLTFDNKQVEAFGTAASANARFKRSDEKLSGMGTLMFTSDVVVIDQVTEFTPNPECNTAVPCATIRFLATVNGEPGVSGEVHVFDRTFCMFENGEGGGFFICGGG